jgi:hypothetical protein
MSRIAGLSLVVLALIGAAANAQVINWSEGAVDAGDLVGTQQTPGPAGFALATISGTISSSTDIDCYSIFIPDPAAFVATTDNGAAGTLGDTQLFLFNKETRNGILLNDDSPIGTTLRSRLTGVAAGGTDFGIVPAPDEYMICVGGYNRDPVSPAGNIWAAGSVGGTFRWENAPVGAYAGPGTPGPLTGWAGTSGTGTYRIDLTGVITKPEPCTMALMGVGALLALRRRR